MNSKSNIPVYKLDKFRSGKEKSSLYQVEVFDANRHFGVQYPHRHDFYEVLYLQKGSGFHIIDENQYEIKPPCIFFLSPGQAHALSLSKDIDGFIFLFTSEFYLLNQKNKSRLLEFPFFFSTERNNPPLLLTDVTDDIFLQSLLKRACRILQSTENNHDDILYAILDLLLLSCENLYPHSQMSTIKSKSNILVKNFLVYIEENYQNNLRINDYAQKLKITPNHLTQVVKQITGKTSVELLHEKIVVEIKRLLIHTNLSLAEIADMMHFDDQSYFTKYFKKYVGKSPLQFRKENIKIG